MPPDSRGSTGLLLAALLGLAAFFLFAGWTVLVPTNIAWLTLGDRAMHQLGWMFFHDAPWGIPPGVSPRLGIELANSIALVDGLPLFAIPFKLVSAWLPRPFQYWGYWLLLSFTLQSVFAYLIARALHATHILALVAAGFVLLTPAFLFRVPMHMALSGHWTILAALWLYVRGGPQRRWTWPLLVGLVAAIHAYLLAMVLAVWLADLVRRWLARELSWRGIAGEKLAVLAVTLAVFWLVGFLMTGSLGTYGFGMYKFNLLGFFIPYRWSELFPQIAHTKYDYEGMAFLGVGILALLAIAILGAAAFRLRRLVSRRWLPLLAVLAIMLVFAVSKDVAVADTELVALPYPKLFVDLATLFRSSGRFVWPLLYLVTIAAVVMTGWRFRPAVAAGLAIAALGLQLYDSRQETGAFARSLPPPAATWPTPLQSEFWERAAAAGFSRLRAIPYRGIGGDWKVLGDYAITHGMDTDAVYLGRVDGAALEALKAAQATAIAAGTLETGTLYILDLPTATAVAAHKADADLLAVIDERIVFARGAASLADGLDLQRLSLPH